MKLRIRISKKYRANSEFGIRNSEITQKYIPCVLKFFYRPVGYAPRKYCRLASLGQSQYSLLLHQFRMPSSSTGSDIRICLRSHEKQAPFYFLHGKKSHERNTSIVAAFNRFFCASRTRICAHLSLIICF